MNEVYVSDRKNKGEKIMLNAISLNTNQLSIYTPETKPISPKTDPKREIQTYEVGFPGQHRTNVSDTANELKQVANAIKNTNAANASKANNVEKANKNSSGASNKLDKRVKETIEQIDKYSKVDDEDMSLGDTHYKTIKDIIDGKINLDEEPYYATRVLQTKDGPVWTMAIRANGGILIYEQRGLQDIEEIEKEIKEDPSCVQNPPFSRKHEDIIHTSCRYSGRLMDKLIEHYKQ